MGPAMAYALAANTAVTMGVFSALGVGLALPMLLLHGSQTLADRLRGPDLG